MKKLSFVAVVLALVCVMLCLTACFGEGTIGLTYQYKSLQTAPLVGTFSGMYIVTGCNSKSADIVIPEEYRSYSVYEIGENAFQDNTTMQTIVLPVSVTVRAYAFSGCSNLQKVYYRSTQEVKERAIIIQYGNDCLTNATWYYYSETQPTQIGNYWHMVGRRAVEW